jgi:hypothetical protein
VVLVFIGNTPSAGFPLTGFRFDGATWSALGTYSDFLGPLVLRVDANGTPYVALTRGFGGSNAAVVEVVRHNGAAWVSMSGVFDSTPNATEGLAPPVFELDAAGQPWVGWAHTFDRARTLHLVQFDGSAFVPLPALPLALESFDGFTFVGGDPVIVGTVNRQINVHRFHAGASEAPILVDPPPGGSVQLVLVPDGGNAMLGVDSLNQVVRTTRVLFP